MSEESTAPYVPYYQEPPQWVEINTSWKATCPNCGCIIELWWRYCPLCGTKLIKETEGEPNE